MEVEEVTASAAVRTVSKSRSATGRPKARAGTRYEGRSRVVQALSALPVSEQRLALLLVETMEQVSEEEHVDPREVRQHVYRLVQAGALQVRKAPKARAELAQTLGPSLADIDPVPHATVEQARRLAALRASLLRSGAYPTAALARARDITPNNARQWISRNRRINRLFTVTYEGETLVPAFLLDERFEPKPGAQRAIEALRSVGEDGWSLWSWFGTPSSWLGGRVPADVLVTEPELVAEAARQRAAAAG